MDTNVWLEVWQPALGFVILGVFNVLRQGVSFQVWPPCCLSLLSFGITRVHQYTRVDTILLQFAPGLPIHETMAGGSIARTREASESQGPERSTLWALGAETPWKRRLAAVSMATHHKGTAQRAGRGAEEYFCLIIKAGDGLWGQDGPV